MSKRQAKPRMECGGPDSDISKEERSRSGRWGNVYTVYTVWRVRTAPQTEIIVLDRGTRGRGPENSEEQRRQEI